MRRLVLGVIGHVDHGKTALVRSLTGTDTDRLPEEKRRGISIALGFAHCRIGDAEVDFIDMPGHEKFVRTMVSGATGIDAALLVVSANEGVSPQTIEHVDIAGLLGLTRAVIAVTKVDLVGPEATAKVAQEALALIRRAGLDAEAPVPVSGITGEGIDGLRRAIANLPVEVGEREDEGFFYLPIDRAFSLAGHGTVVTGTLRRGPLSGARHSAVLLPSGKPVRLRRIQVHGSTVASACCGQRVAVNLRGVEPSEAPRGAALATEGALEATSWLSVELRSVPGAPILSTSESLLLLYGTDEVDIRLRLLDRDELRPGETALAQLRTAREVMVPARERFILRSASPARTVGGGCILETAAARLRRHAPGVLSRLDSLARSVPSEILKAELDRAGSRGISIGALARVAGLGPGRVRALLGELGVVLDKSDVAATPATLEGVVAQVRALVEAGELSTPAGLSREQLQLLVPEAAPSLLHEAAHRLTAGGILRSEAGRYRIKRPGADERRGLEDAIAVARLVEQIREAGLKPPDVLQDPKSRLLIDRLVRQGTLVRTLDRVQEREIVFHQDAIEAAKQRLAPMLAEGSGLLVGDIGAALGISRKFSVPLLEYLDMIRFTRRVADRRTLYALS